ncbi:formyltransferase/hydrolase complex Fhc subunit C [Methylocella tundrae]|uniref:Formyltransferase/hydrolase complex Fhc subunit C n=1 Tax=Methylocella tundrae TaxID=227605 RepID=A0A8B6M1S9_METTU|nr:formylmethanofuran dehydrogenase subunit C [Methylocella tundrae]VTZ26292.1 Formyltransferase/hydrolase complex Fhc subunit C [Methylocella tundrae]VTZ48122.1 formyltransferase/hydrolase complex Fhc subunit C [Methylocella tundrae]
MTLVLALKQEPDQRLDLSPLSPHGLDGKSASEIAAIELQTTREKRTVGDIFDITPGGVETIRFEGGSTRFDHLGHGLKSGEIILEGDCGHAAGRAMSGGRLVINGDAGPFAGSALSGGSLEIKGNAGDFLGAPLDGEMEGMTGGLLVVRGKAGHRAGDRLRRGTIVIEGAAGDYLGSRIIAGTLIAVGGAGLLPGYLMRRGTILVGATPALAPTFVDCGAHELSFAGVFSRFLRKESKGAAELFAKRLRRFAGDTAVLGKGEVFFPA